MSLYPDDSLRLQAVSSEANPPVGFPFVSLMIQNMYALTYRQSGPLLFPRTPINRLQM